MMSSAHPALGRGLSNSFAIDLGTSKVSVAVIDEEGKIVLTAARDLPRAVTMADGGVVQKPTVWLATLATLVREVGKSVPFDRVKDIGVTGTTPTLVGLDEHGQLVEDLAVMWNDTNRRGPALPSGVGVGLQKLAALGGRDPALLGRSAHIIDQANFVAYYLTGLLSVNAATLSQKFNWDRRTGYGAAGFESLGVEELLLKFPRRVLETGEVLGPLKAGPAAKLGLPAGISVVVAGYDSVASLVGGGLFEPSDRMLVTVGTSVGFYLVPQDQQAERSGPWVWRDSLLPHGLKTVAGGLEAGMQTIGLVHRSLRLSCSAAERDGALERLVARAETAEPAETFALPFGPRCRTACSQPRSSMASRRYRAGSRRSSPSAAESPTISATRSQTSRCGAFR
jgi:sugar (pentulose or hexulose) kinase